MVPPTDLEQALTQLQASPDQADVVQIVINHISSTLPSHDLDKKLKKAADVATSAPLGVVSTRAIINAIIDKLRALNNPDLTVSVGEQVVCCISSQPSLASSLVEVGAITREIIASAHESNDDHVAAARVLSEIPLDASQRRITDPERAVLWVRIMRNYLEVGDSTTAQTYLNKLKNVIHNLSGDRELTLHFKLSVARIQDSNREFLAAAQTYHDISGSPAVAEDERLLTLGMAIKCAVLAPAGPPRSRVLARLYKDERSVGLPEHGILEKIYLDRLLDPAEVAKFAESLQPHQLATTADGSTVLARAVVEHNLLGVSRLYSTISLASLGEILGLMDEAKVEETTARMIEQGRLTGSIDQIARVVSFFGGGDFSGDREGGRAVPPVARAMRRWDVDVQAIAESVEHVVDELQSEFPEFVAAHQALAKAQAIAAAAQA